MVNYDKENQCLSVKNLRTVFPMDGGKKLVAVDNASFELYHGETLGVVGESGSGKSMMVKSILKLVPRPGITESGEVYLNGEDIMKYSDREMRKKVRGTKLSMIFQEPMTALNPSFTIEQQVGEVFQLHTKMNKKEREAATIELLKMVRIPDPEKRIKDYPHQFSGGMRQRAVIAVALACHPEILIADEPTTALDVTVQADIMDLLDDLKKREKLAIILISHNLNMVTERSDRIVVFYAGHVMEMATSQQLVKAPLHPYTQGLMNSLPDIQIEGQKITAIPGELPDLSNTPSGCPFHPRCSKATPLCSQVKPELVEVEPGHFCRCHLCGKQEVQNDGE